MAPMIIGGDHAKTAFRATGSDTLDESTRLHDVQIERLGADVLIRGCANAIISSASNSSGRSKKTGNSQAISQQ